MSTLTTFIQYKTILPKQVILVTAIREEKEKQGIKIGKEVQLSLLAYDKILYI